MKLIIDIPQDIYDYRDDEDYIKMSADKISNVLQNGTPLDDIKTEIEQLNPVDYGSMFSYESHNGAKDMKMDVLDIIDKHIGERSEDDKKTKGI